MIKIEKVNFKGWPNCWRVSNGEVELVVTGDVGPRVMRYGFAGGQNFFKEFAGQMGKAGEAEWQPGGEHVHRTGGSAHGDGEENHDQNGGHRNGGGIDPRGAQRRHRTLPSGALDS